MSVLTIGYSFSMKILHNLFKLNMKRFVIVRNLLYVTACLTKLHIIARCIAEQTVSVRVGWAEISTGRLFKHGLLFFRKVFQTRPLFKQVLNQAGALVRMHTIYQCDTFFLTLSQKQIAFMKTKVLLVEEQIVSIHYLAAKPKPPLNENISE